MKAAFVPSALSTASSSYWPCVATTTSEFSPTPAASRSRVVTTRPASGWLSGSPRSSTTTVRQPNVFASEVRVPTMGVRPIITRWGFGSTGCTNSSMAPSLWHCMGTRLMPSLARASNSSGDPSRTSWGSPVSSALRASRITTDSAQAPLNQPRTLPAAVTMAWFPGCAEEGARRHTTVARANGSPRRDRSWRNCKRSSVIGHRRLLGLNRLVPYHSLCPALPRWYAPV